MSQVMTAVTLIAVIFVLGITFGYLVALFTGRGK
jgi:hypothetical protein